MQEENNKKIITRFAPSPTGFLHIGTYRTAIFSYLFAKKYNGIFVLRIEDTDKERSKKEYEENIIDSLNWLGLKYDVFYRQSDNKEKHKQYLEKMIKEGTAYISKEEAKDGSGILKELIRFKNPNIEISFNDEIKGKITIDTTDLGDFVIARCINDPLYNFAVVIDDFEEGITHVIRGEDHTSNTPRQILIQRAIGAPEPLYAHLPLVLGPDKLKLSKRRGALSIMEYKKLGYLPEAILNGVAFVGWNPGTPQEIFTHKELIQTFNLSRVQKSPAVFNQEKLDWFNKEHMNRLSFEELKENILKYLSEELLNFSEEKIEKIILLIKDRISKWSDVEKMKERGELDLFYKNNEYEKEKLLYKNSTFEKISKNLKLVIEKLEELDLEKFDNIEDIKNLLMSIADKLDNRGELLHPIRIALSCGMDKSPDPFTIISILGKEESLNRLKKAVLYID